MGIDGDADAVGDGAASTTSAGIGNCAAVSEVADAGVAVGVSVAVGDGAVAAAGADIGAAAGAVAGVAVGVGVAVGDGAAVATGAGAGDGAAAMAGTVGDADAPAKTGVSSGSGGGSQAASDSATSAPIRASAAARPSQFAVWEMMKPSDDAGFNVFRLSLVRNREVKALYPKGDSAQWIRRVLGRGTRRTAARLYQNQDS